jgi:hypothetical protein
MKTNSEYKLQSGEIDWAIPCKTDRCPICAVGEHQEYIFYIHYQAQLYHESSAREKVMDDLGFCNYHAWQLSRIAGPEGTAIINYDLIWKSVKLMEQYLSETERTVDFTPQCLICHQFKRQEEQLQQSFIDYLVTESGIKNYSRSNGLCIPHLQNILQNQLNIMIQAFLLENEKKLFIKLKSYLYGYLKKQREKNRASMSKAEIESERRSLEKLVGRRGLKWRV